MTDNNEIVVGVPMPPVLKIVSSPRSVHMSVRMYFEALYPKPEFRNLLASVNNKTSITANRLFDRYDAVKMIKELAATKGDTAVVGTKPGYIYKTVVRLLRKNDMGLKLRRKEYLLLTQQAAE